MSKLKTIRVYATIHTELHVDINVPESVSEELIWEKIRIEDMIDGDLMTKADYPYDWNWDEPDYDADFNPNAVDYSEWFKETEDE